MSDQIRKEKEIVGKKEDSAFKLSRETEQKIIREFRSPFPDKRNEQEDGILTANACSRLN
ncbi:hypothetical protein [Rhizobium sp. SG741]|uniref:hypothetical protein n=1 Tax=Rhizobium sp. SG741 TaxID=2587114 RepID=UPI001448461D|nr:hypothetical protein [Rhizobium sp. SG741]NKJ03491.1 hypothetical protein [Rhizobium sp. SG741]